MIPIDLHLLFSGLALTGTMMSRNVKAADRLMLSNCCCPAYRYHSCQYCRVSQRDRHSVVVMVFPVYSTSTKKRREISKIV